MRAKAQMRRKTRPFVTSRKHETIQRHKIRFLGMVYGSAQFKSQIQRSSNFLSFTVFRSPPKQRDQKKSRSLEGYGFSSPQYTYYVEKFTVTTSNGKNAGQPHFRGIRIKWSPEKAAELGDTIVIAPGQGTPALSNMIVSKDNKNNPS